MKCRICCDLTTCDDHPELCCDCADVAFGMPLELVNAERAKRGAPALEKPAPPCRPDCKRCERALPLLGVWSYNNWRSFGGECA